MNNNLSIVKGNIGRDPELRMTQSNTKVATFSVGVNRSNPKGDTKPITDWFNCVAWGDQADIVETQVKKGMFVQITGKFQTRNYDDKDGKKVYVTELWVDEIAKVLKKQVNNEFNNNTVMDEDLPF